MFWLWSDDSASEEPATASWLKSRRVNKVSTDWNQEPGIRFLYFLSDPYWKFSAVPNQHEATVTHKVTVLPSAVKNVPANHMTASQGPALSRDCRQDREPGV